MQFGAARERGRSRGLMRQAIRILVLTVLVVLLLPYLLAALYRIGHPVSTLMAWRWLTGAPVSRQWLDFVAISPLLPRSVVASEDAKFCSHHRIDWDALRDVALLAAILPNPVRRSARNPGAGVRRLAGTYMARAQAAVLQRCWSENRAF